MNNPYNAPAADLSVRGGDTASYQPQVFAIKGRIGRVRYVAYSVGLVLALSVGMGLVMGVLGAMMGVADSAGTMMVLTVLIYIPLFAVGIIMAIRRVHDMGYSGWLSLLSLVPLVNFWLLFGPGTQGTNEYGPPPVKNSTGVIVSAVLVVLFFVFAMLAAVSLPAYQAYRMKSKAAQEQLAPTPSRTAPVTAHLPGSNADASSLSDLGSSAAKIPGPVHISPLSRSIARY